MIPLDLQKEGETSLAIKWDDEHKSLYDLRSLRKSCPCASCRGTRPNPDHQPLRVLSPSETLAEQIQLVQAEIVGRYALQFTWSDGHHEGIYSFDYLRELCECPECRALDRNPKNI